MGGVQIQETISNLFGLAEEEGDDALTFDGDDADGDNANLAVSESSQPRPLARPPQPRSAPPFALSRTGRSPIDIGGSRVRSLAFSACSLAEYKNLPHGLL